MRPAELEVIFIFSEIVSMIRQKRCAFARLTLNPRHESLSNAQIQRDIGEDTTRGIARSHLKRGVNEDARCQTRVADTATDKSPTRTDALVPQIVIVVSPTRCMRYRVNKNSTDPHGTRGTNRRDTGCISVNEFGSKRESRKMDTLVAGTSIHTSRNNLTAAWLSTRVTRKCKSYVTTGHVAILTRCGRT